MQLKRNHVDFKLYCTKIILPVLRKLKVVLKCKNVAKRNSMVYVLRGAEESLLGRRDGEVMEIIKIDPTKEEQDIKTAV